MAGLLTDLAVTEGENLLVDGLTAAERELIMTRRRANGLLTSTEGRPNLPPTTTPNNPVPKTPGVSPIQGPPQPVGPTPTFIQQGNVVSDTTLAKLVNAKAQAREQGTNKPNVPKSDEALSKGIHSAIDFTTDTGKTLLGYQMLSGMLPSAQDLTGGSGSGGGEGGRGSGNAASFMSEPGDQWVPNPTFFRIGPQDGSIAGGWPEGTWPGGNPMAEQQ